MPRRSKNLIHRHQTGRDHGLTLISTTVIMTVAFALGVSLISYMLSSRRAAHKFEVQINTLQYAEAGIQKALYCLNADTGTNCGGTYGHNYAGESHHPFNDGEFTVTLTGTDDDRVITSTGWGALGQKTTVKAAARFAIPPIRDTYFDYSLMVIDDVTLDNEAVIDSGPIYSDTDVECLPQTDIRSDVYVSKPGGRIYKCTIDGEAHADDLDSVTASGDCYWLTQFKNSSCAGTVYPNEPTPPAQPLPTFDLDLWRAEALYGGTITGDYSAPDGSSLGPVQITGDLEVEGGAFVNMTGPIWVMGDIHFEENSGITLDPSFGELSSVLFSDHPTLNQGRIIIDNNVVIDGSGTPGSYILVLSTMADPDAIDVSNNTTGAIFYAPAGGVTVNNNASCAAVAGLEVTVRNNAELLYGDLGLPGELALQTLTSEGFWDLVSGTWREL